MSAYYFDDTAAVSLESPTGEKHNIGSRTLSLGVIA